MRSSKAASSQDALLRKIRGAAAAGLEEEEEGVRAPSPPLAPVFNHVHPHRKWEPGMRSGLPNAKNRKLEKRVHRMVDALGACAGSENALQHLMDAAEMEPREDEKEVEAATRVLSQHSNLALATCTMVSRRVTTLADAAAELHERQEALVEAGDDNAAAAEKNAEAVRGVAKATEVAINGLHGSFRQLHTSTLHIMQQCLERADGQFSTRLQQLQTQQQAHRATITR